MDIPILQAIFLGFVQGITEFLPISSSAHLVLTPWLFGWEDPGLTFDVALHFGTLIAVVGYFWKDWLEIFTNIFKKISNEESGIKQKYPQNLLWLIVAATIPGVLAGYFFNKQAESLFREPLLIAAMLAFFGLILILADKRSVKTRNIGDITFKDALVVGLLQSLAIIPGVSRSGITITAGLQQGLSRKEAAKFSFLLSTPIIFGAAVYQAKDIFSAGFGVAELVGIAVSAASGYIAIFSLIKFVEKSSFSVFFWYRMFIAILIIASLVFVG